MRALAFLALISTSSPASPPNVVAPKGGFEFKRLHAAEATATSHLKSNWNKYEENYHPNYVLDDDPKTAWVEGVDGDGVGQSLTVKLSTLKSARALKLVLFPGYQKSAGLLAANGAPTKVTVTVKGPGDVLSARQTLNLATKTGAQTFELPLTHGLSTVTLTIDAVRAGKKYADTCLSDVQFFVDSDVPYDARVEKLKRDELRKWKTKRLAEAKYFASLPRTYPFTSSDFHVESAQEQQLQRRYTSISENGEGEPNPDYVELPDWIKAGKQTPGFPAEERALVLKLIAAKGPQRMGEGRWYSLSGKDVKFPAGLDALPQQLSRLVRHGDASLFESREQALVDDATKNDDEYSSTSVSNVQLLDGTPAAPRRAFLRIRETMQDRVVTQISTWLLLDWGEDGLLSRVLSWADQEFDGLSGVTRAKVVRFVRVDGKVAGVTVNELWSSDSDIEGFADESHGLSATQTVYKPGAK